jgi:hypothetical protein
MWILPIHRARSDLALLIGRQGHHVGRFLAGLRMVVRIVREMSAMQV